MKCPKCKTEELHATKLADSLPVMGCQQCSGSLISLLYYRDWAERNSTLVDTPKTSEKSSEQEDTGDTSVALSCPKCARLMRKYRISGCQNNRLDLCTTCDDVWLDNGEWEMLTALELCKQMPKVFTDAWQLKVRAQARDEERKNRYLKILGEEDLNKSEQLRNWLKDHPKKQDILFYINHE